jgi:hypothetical protein
VLTIPQAESQISHRAHLVEEARKQWKIKQAEKGGTQRESRYLVFCTLEKRHMSLAMNGRSLRGLCFQIGRECKPGGDPVSEARGDRRRGKVRTGIHGNVDGLRSSCRCCSPRKAIAPGLGSLGREASRWNTRRGRVWDLKWAAGVSTAQDSQSSSTMKDCFGV